MDAVEGRPCQLTVCRGCCCGTRKKVPGVDHGAQLARLSAVEDHSGRTVPVRTSKCLGICFQANVVVVQPSQAGRAAGGRPAWLGGITEDRLVEAVDDWVFRGGPGIAALPAALADHVTSKDAQKPKKSKKPKHSKAAKKERRKAEEKERRKAGKKAEEKERRKAAKKAAKKERGKAGAGRRADAESGGDKGKRGGKDGEKHGKKGRGDSGR